MRLDCIYGETWNLSYFPGIVPVATLNAFLRRTRVSSFRENSLTWLPLFVGLGCFSIASASWGRVYFFPVIISILFVGIQKRSSISRIWVFGVLRQSVFFHPIDGCEALGRKITAAYV